MTPSTEAWLRARVHNPRTLDRLLRANAGTTEGECIAGRWRPSSAWRQRTLVRGFSTKGRFIRAFGRAMWDAIPPALIIREGRRQAAPLGIAFPLIGLPPDRLARAKALLAIQHPRPGYQHVTDEVVRAWREILAP